MAKTPAAPTPPVLDGRAPAEFSLAAAAAASKEARREPATELPNVNNKNRNTAIKSKTSLKEFRPTTATAAVINNESNAQLFEAMRSSNQKTPTRAKKFLTKSSAAAGSAGRPNHVNQASIASSIAAQSDLPSVFSNNGGKVSQKENAGGPRRVISKMSNVPQTAALTQPLQGGNLRAGQNVKVLNATGDILMTEVAGYTEESPNKIDLLPGQAYLNSQPSMGKLRKSGVALASATSLPTSEQTRDGIKAFLVKSAEKASLRKMAAAESTNEKVAELKFLSLLQDRQS